MGLMKCPFCGEVKSAEVFGLSETGGRMWKVICDVQKGGCGASGSWEDTKEKAVEAWNRRSE